MPQPPVRTNGLESCAFCGRKTKLNGSPLSFCLCKTVKYCSKDCQTKDWPRHKKDCLAARKCASVSSPTSLQCRWGRRVNVVLLAEKLTNDECVVKNATIVSKIIGTPPYSNPQGSNILFVAEGREKNPCYEGIQVHKRLPGNIIQEYDSSKQTTEEMLYKFIIISELSEALAEGETPTNSQGKILGKAFIIEQMNIDGFKNLLKKCGAYSLYLKVLDYAEAKDFANYIQTLTEVYKMILATGINDLSPTVKQNVKSLLNDVIIKQGYFSHALPCFNYLQKQRDIRIIQRVEDYILKNKHITIVIIIFGGAHYTSLKELIETSKILQLDNRSNATYGGKQYTKKRKTLKKYKKNNKKTYRRRN